MQREVKKYGNKNRRGNEITAVIIMRKYFYASILPIMVVTMLCFAACDKTDEPSTNTGANGDATSDSGSSTNTGDYSPETCKLKLWPAAAVVNEGGDNQSLKYGYINEAGEFAIAAIYDDASAFSCGYAAVRLSDKTLIINEKNAIQNTPSILMASGTFYYNHVVFRTKNNGSCGMMNNKMEVVIQPNYSYMSNMSADGLVCVKPSEEEKMCVVNSKGEQAFSANFDQIYNFESGYAVVKNGDLYGVIDKSGAYTIELQKKMLVNCGAGRIGFYDSDVKKFGLMNYKGDVIVEPIYDDYGTFATSGLLPVLNDGLCGFIDKDGKIIIPLQYAHVGQFTNGRAWVRRSVDTNYELIDTKGQVLLTLGKDEEPAGTWRLNRCLIKVKINDDLKEYKYINEKGETVYKWQKK